uniref:Uncharacterized protein n=1 Tax=Plectus sambesii TaxID=2011161 RepID=A0A914W413_9BILA
MVVGVGCPPPDRLGDFASVTDRQSATRDDPLVIVGTTKRTSPAIRLRALTLMATTEAAMEAGSLRATGPLIRDDSCEIGDAMKTRTTWKRAMMIGMACGPVLNPGDDDENRVRWEPTGEVTIVARRPP